MYSYEERLKAVQLYIQYDKSYASVFRELGYPPSSLFVKVVVSDSVLGMYTYRPSCTPSSSEYIPVG